MILAEIKCMPLEIPSPARMRKCESLLKSRLYIYTLLHSNNSTKPFLEKFLKDKNEKRSRSLIIEKTHVELITIVFSRCIDKINLNLIKQSHHVTI